MKLYLALIFFVGSTVSYGQQLPLSQYLEEVKQAHSGYKGAVEKSKGSAGRSDEGALLYSPNAFAETKYADDQRVTSSPVSQGLESKSQSLSVGVSKQTSFGMQSKLYYAVQNMSLDGPQSTALPDKKFYDSSLNLEVSQPLWKNGFGEDLKAQEKQIALSAKASSMGEQFAAKQILIMAEKAYWRLAIAEEQLKVQNQSYDRAKKITNSQEDRSKRNLIDNSDLLQARAALKMRELDLKAATNESRLALKAFNDLRGQPSGQIAQLD